MFIDDTNEDDFKLVSVSKPERKPTVKHPPQQQSVLFLKAGLPGQLDFLDLATENEDAEHQTSS